MKSLQSTTRKSLSVRALSDDVDEEEEVALNQNASISSVVSSNFVLRRQASKIKAASTSHIDISVLEKPTPEETISDSSWIQDISKNRDKYFEKIISEFDTLHDRLRETADSYKRDVRVTTSSTQTIADWDSILTQDTKDYISILKKEIEDLVLAHQEEDRENKRKFEEQIEQIRKFHDEQFRFIQNKSEELKAREYVATEIKVRNELDKQEYKTRQEMHAYKKKLETFMENYIQKEFKPHLEQMFNNVTVLMDMCKRFSLSTSNNVLREECERLFKKIDRPSMFDITSKLKVIKSAILSSNKLDAVTVDAEVQADETSIFIEQTVLQKKLQSLFHDKAVMVGAYTYESFCQTDLDMKDLIDLLEHTDKKKSKDEFEVFEEIPKPQSANEVSPYNSISSSTDSVAKHQLHKFVSSEKKHRKLGVSREGSPSPLTKQTSKTPLRESIDEQMLIKQRDTPPKGEQRSLRKFKQEEKPQTPQPFQNQTPIHSPIHTPILPPQHHVNSTSESIEKQPKGDTEQLPLKSVEPSISQMENTLQVEGEMRESQTEPLEETEPIISEVKEPTILFDMAKVERPIDNPVDMLEQVFSPRSNESKKVKTKTEFTRIKKQQEKKKENIQTQTKPLQKKGSQILKKQEIEASKPLPRLSLERLKSDPTINGNLRQSFPQVSSQVSLQSSQCTQTTERLSVSPRIPIKLPKLDLPTKEEEDSEVVYSSRSSSSLVSSDITLSISLSTIAPKERVHSGVKKRKRVKIDAPRKSLPKLCEADKELIKRMPKVGTSIDDHLIPILEDLFIRAELDPLHHFSKFTMKQRTCLIITQKLFPKSLGALNTILEETPKTPHLSVKTPTGDTFEEEYDKLLNYISYLKLSFKRKEFLLTNQLKNLEVKLEELVSHNHDIRNIGESLRMDQSLSISKLSNENVMLIQKIEHLNKQIQDIITGKWKYDSQKKELVYVKFTEEEPTGHLDEITNLSGSYSRVAGLKQSLNLLNQGSGMDRTH